VHVVMEGQSHTKLSAPWTNGRLHDGIQACPAIYSRTQTSLYPPTVHAASAFSVGTWWWKPSPSARVRFVTAIFSIQ